MPGHCCCVPMCKSCSFSPGCKGISFHKFPRSEEVKQKWLINIRRDNWIPKNEKVCSLHFLKTDYFQGTKRNQLYPHAVPTVFSEYPSYLQSKSTPKRKRLACRANRPKQTITQAKTEQKPNTPVNETSSETDVEHLEDESVNETLRQVQQDNALLRKEIKSKDNKIARLQKSLDLYRVLVSVLRGEIACPLDLQQGLTLTENAILESTAEET